MSPFSDTDVDSSLTFSFSFVRLPGQLSADVEKVNIPGRKRGFRLFGNDGAPICDLLQTADEPVPEVSWA